MDSRERHSQGRSGSEVPPPAGLDPSPGDRAGPQPLVGPRTWPVLRRLGRLRPVERGPTIDEVAAAMVLLAVALQSGCGVVEAIEEVAAAAPGPAGRDLGVVAAALRWGVTEEPAWAMVSASWTRVAVALRLAATAGVAPSTLLLSGAEDLRAARLATVEASAARLGVRLVLPLGLAFLPAFVMTTVVPVVIALARQALEP